jgi:NodT family efflux transporter outer membrane factor (OMF) lipoprotein
MLKKAHRLVCLLASCSVGALAACASPPNLGARPELASSASYASVESFAAPTSAWPSDHWWESYGDTQLNALIEEALADSPSLEAAAARVRSAEAAAQRSGAARYPTIGAQNSAQALRQEFSADNLSDTLSGAFPDDWSSQSSAALKLDYQLDFFGANRAAFAAASSRADAAKAEETAARLQLAASVALAYAEFARLSADHDAAQDAARMRSTSLQLVRQRVGNGLENEGQLRQAEAEFARARADLVSVCGAIARTRNELAALLGKGPDRGLSIEAPRTVILAGPALPSDVDLDLIGRRPDLAAARLRAEAAAARIDAARADYYPNINLAAVVSLQTLGLDRIGGGELATASIGPAVSLPIFSGGRLDGAYRGARAEYDEAVALYNHALTNALREVADALVAHRALQAQLVLEHEALEDAQEAYRIARTRYEGGLASYIDTLSVESSLIAQRRAVADLGAQALALDITLKRALGGGYRAA